MTYLERIHNFPPVLVRLLARKRYGPPLTTEEISKQSPSAEGIFDGISCAEVEAISKETSWCSIGYYESLAFQRGCGLEFHDNAAVRRVNDYLSRRPTFRYLRASPLWKSYYKPLLVLYRQSFPADLKANPPTHLAPHVLRLVKVTTILMR